MSFVLLMALFPVGSGLFDALGGDGPADGGELQLVPREDLNGASTEPYWPFFLELTGSLGGADAVRAELSVVGAGGANVRAFPPGSPSVPWTPEEGTHRGTLPGPDGGATWTARDVADDGTVGLLLMTIFDAPGTYELAVTPYDAATGRPAGQAAATVTVAEPSPYLFERPLLGPWGEAAWSEAATAGRGMGFSLEANTTAAWDAEWGTYYNWTVTAICPTGMAVGGDLAQYNTGDLRVDRAALNATSAVSAWENGYNTVFYTVWDAAGGTRLTGEAAMTPTGKELAYGSGAYHSWTTGTWTPFGAGTVTFHHPGHYLLVISLADGRGNVSPPIVLETAVSA